MKLDVRRKVGALWRESVALVRAALAHDIYQLAAALTYYAILSVVPALLVVVSILGLVGVSSQTLDAILTEVLATTKSDWAVEVVDTLLASVFSSSSAGLALGAGALTAIWSASAYVRSLMSASGRIYGVKERRSYLRSLPVRLGLALLLILLAAAAVAILVLLLGPIRDWITGTLGIAETREAGWATLAWTLLLGASAFSLALLFKYTPNRAQPSLWRLLIGAVVTVVAWLLASVGYSIYFANFSSYNRVYGALGAVVGFFVWAWIMNIAVLAGVEVNRAIEQLWGGAKAADADDAADETGEDDAADGAVAADGADAVSGAPATDEAD